MAGESFAVGEIERDHRRVVGGRRRGLERGSASTAAGLAGLGGDFAGAGLPPLMARSAGLASPGFASPPCRRF